MPDLPAPTPDQSAGPAPYLSCSDCRADAFGLAVPAALEERQARERRAENRAKTQGTMATRTDALRDELASLTPAEPVTDDPFRVGQGPIPAR